jgi:hypothetical protein
MDASALKREAHPWIERFARFGYASKGVVYILMAYLALKAALGSGSAESSRGAFEEVSRQPLGHPLLFTIGAGLFAYALWLMYAAVFNPERDKPFRRLSRASMSLINGALGVAAFSLAWSTRDQGGDGQQAISWTARGLSQPLGTLLVGGVGVGFALYGVRQVWRGLAKDFDDQLRLSQAEAYARKWLVRASRFGFVARGVVFALIGVFLVKAALEYDAGEARDIGGALRELQQHSYGSVALGVVAAGLAGYGIYELARARYRHIDPSA